MNHLQLTPEQSQGISFYGFLNLFLSLIYIYPGCLPWVERSFIINGLLSVFAVVLKCLHECFHEVFPLSRQARYRFDSFYLALFGPVSLCVALGAAIWGFFHPTPRCKPTVFALTGFFMTVAIHVWISTILYERFQVWWDFYMSGPLDTVPYHPNREELMRRRGDNSREEQEYELKGMTVGLLQADQLNKGEKQAGGVRNTMREKTCPICYADFEIGEKVVDVPSCLHTFHEQCIVSWLEKSHTCPMCRGVIRKKRQRPRADLENGIN